jgi:P27 family predicted phage terminase small subunit
MRGRKPNPSALNALLGFPGKRPPNVHEPQPAVTPSPRAPSWMDKEAKKEWRRLAPVLGSLGVLTETDTDALTAYCEAWATWKGATQKIREFGLVIKHPTAGKLPVVSPYVKIAHNAMTQMRALLVEFGMTPSSRSRIHVAPKEQADPLARFIQPRRA